jgi:drug/metabolite transporter (DMT)-like permease
MSNSGSENPNSENPGPGNPTPGKNIHVISGRRGYGFFLTLLACTLWGIFPIAVKSVLLELDPYTVNFYRFSLAGAILLPYLISRRQLSGIYKTGGSDLRLRLLVCGSLLIANYLFYTYGVQHITPEATQVLIQLATILLLVSAVFLFGETFSRLQWIGCAIFLCGLFVFFYPRILVLLDGMNTYGLGMGLITLSAVTWTTYAILQKQLLVHFTSSQVMIVVYMLGALIFLPLAHPGEIVTLSPINIGLLIFCGTSTLLGAGSFAEALAHLEASKISAMMTTLPIFTLVFMFGLSLVPGFNIAAEPLSATTLVGAALVVCGALLVALKGHDIRNSPENYKR